MKERRRGERQRVRRTKREVTMGYPDGIRKINEDAPCVGMALASNQ